MQYLEIYSNSQLNCSAKLKHFIVLPSFLLQIAPTLSNFYIKKYKNFDLKIIYLNNKSEKKMF